MPQRQQGDESARRIAQQKKESARREERQVPNTVRAFRKAGGHTNESVQDRSAPGRSGALPPPVHDDGWQTCHECGAEGDATEQRQLPDALEPDCFGTYYCLDCWQQWDRGDIEDDKNNSVSTPHTLTKTNRKLLISGVSESTVWYKPNRSHIPHLRVNSSDFPKTSF